MAKARATGCVKDRAIKAFKRAHPSCPYGVHAWKNRGKQIVRVRGYEGPDKQHGAVITWSYADNGYLQKVS